MRRVLLLIIFLLTIGIALAEAAPEVATLRFSSFDGGGHVYRAVVEDPAIVAIRVDYDYGDIGDEPIDGAPYDAVFTITGLAPGTTIVTVEGRSPILENDDAIYTAAVDEALNVTLTPVRTLSTFYLYRGGEMNYPMYQIRRERDGYRMSVDEGPERIIGQDAVDALLSVIDAWDVEAWDSFEESNEYVLDGEDFWLEIRLTDGTHIVAKGDNAFPKNYASAMGEMWDILEGTETASAE